MGCSVGYLEKEALFMKQPVSLAGLLPKQMDEQSVCYGTKAQMCRIRARVARNRYGGLLRLLEASREHSPPVHGSVRTPVAARRSTPDQE